MAYFEYDQFQLIEKIITRYTSEFPECDLAKRVEELSLMEGFRKNAYLEETKQEVLEHIESGMFDDNEEEIELTEDELVRIAERVIRWTDFTAQDENINEAINDELTDRNERGALTEPA